jgi:MFS family permease
MGTDTLHCGIPRVHDVYSVHMARRDHRPETDRWTMLAIVSVAVLLGMSLWFAATALTPELRARWSLDASQAAWLTTIVQLGFVAGTATIAVLNLADLLPTRALFAACAAAGAAVNLGLLAAPGYAAALALRFLTGFFLAGVYPPAMKMIATWFRHHRGLAIGAVVGALTVGKGLPYLIHSLGGATHLETVVVATSAGAVGAALLVGTLFAEGPFPFPRRPFTWGLVGTVWQSRPTRLAIASYLGHMWELYAMWVWAPAFLAASLAARDPAASPDMANALAFGVLACGGIGCVWGGWMAERWGYARVVIVAMVISGLCSLGIGFLFGASPWLLVPVAWIWGFFVVADSAQFSAMVTETAEPHSVGTALTLQTSLGFLLTMATIQLVPVLVEGVGWRWAFPILALGPAAGIAAAGPLRGMKRAT